MDLINEGKLFRRNYVASFKGSRESWDKGVPAIFAGERNAELFELFKCSGKYFRTVDDTSIAEEES